MNDIISLGCGWSFVQIFIKTTQMKTSNKYLLESSFCSSVAKQCWLVVFVSLVKEIIKPKIVKKKKWCSLKLNLSVIDMVIVLLNIAILLASANLFALFDFFFG